MFQEKEYIYQGRVYLSGDPFKEVEEDSDGHNRFVWVFPLKRVDGSIPLIPISKLEITQEENIQSSARRYNIMQLKIKADQSRGEPGYRSAVTKVYQRNANIINYTLRRANGICELCKTPAPFKKKNGDPYLEIHHIIPLAKGGPDVIDNTVGLCPNCHRKMHSVGLSDDIKKLNMLEK